MGDQASAKVRGSRKTRPRSALTQPIPPSSPTILLSVAGLSPQVITETLYCLCAQRSPPTDVREVHVLTTRAGEARVREQLLHPRGGWFHRFCRVYAIPAGQIRFDQTCIHVLTAADGRPLDDVRTPEDSARVADTLLALVRDLTRDPAVALHASVAGGRKTMGLFLGIAFQLFARPQDRLSHVLVWPPELEGHREFFYPLLRSTTYSVGRRTIRSRDVRVELAEIPVLLLRDRVQAIGLESLSYSALVAQAQTDLDRLFAPPPLTLESSSRSLRVAGRGVPLTPLEFAVYSLLARRRVAGCSRADCPGCSGCSLELGQFLDAPVLDEIGGVLENIGARDERARLLRGWRPPTGEPQERFLQVRSRINAKIRRALGPGRWADRYSIVGRREAGASKRYVIPLDPGGISFG